MPKKPRKTALRTATLAPAKATPPIDFIDEASFAEEKSKSGVYDLRTGKKDAVVDRSDYTDKSGGITQKDIGWNAALPSLPLVSGKKQGNSGCEANNVMDTVIDAGFIKISIKYSSGRNINQS